MKSLQSRLRLTMVLGFLPSLYILPEVNVPIFRVHLSETFRYLYSYSGEGLNSLDSQLRLTVVLGCSAFLIYPTRSILWLFLVCTSLRLSGIFTVSQQRCLNSLESHLRLTVVLGFLAFLIYPTRSYCAYFW